MKCIPVFFLCSAALCAQTFFTGQAARLVIGQTTFTAEDTSSSATVLGGVSGVAYAANTLFVADSNLAGSAPVNNRVLVFGNLSSQLPAPTAELQYNSKCPVCVGQATVVLGQPDFVTSSENDSPTSNDLRLPTAVASDGVHLAVADTNHNRVLIWNHIPTNNNQPADVVIGQPDFVSDGLPGNQPNAKSMRGPQGVWIQNGQLFVADTQNNRVLVYNHIPTTNGVAADLVIGAPNFTTAANPDVSQQTTNASDSNTLATASNMLNPVAVTSDGTRLFVTDLGNNRVLIFNRIPTTNGAAADVAVGQPDLVSAIANNAYTGTAATSSTDNVNKETPVLCTVSNGTDLYGNPTYQNFCNQTLNFPRFAMVAGSRFLISDGGNDRVLIYEKIPAANGVGADAIIGQIGGNVNEASNAADSLRTPMAMAWDGTNLYVADTYNRRINVYTIGASTVGYQGIRNAANLNIAATGSIAISFVTPTSLIQAGDVITITINTVTYNYTVLSTDTLASVVTGICSLINNANSGAGDIYVIATPDGTPGTTTVILTGKQPGNLGNYVSYSATYAPATGVAATTVKTTTAGPNLTGGGDAASIAPGTVVSILGTNLSAGSVSADMTQNQLPTQLGGTEVYFNGIPAPLFFVSPTQINAQIPWELGDTTSVSAYVRSVMADGSIMFTSAVAVIIVPANPGIYTTPGTSPPAAMAYHYSSNATAIVSVDGSVAPGSTATVTVNGRVYSYTASALDTLDAVRDNLVEQINTDPQVSATAAGVFDRIILKARVAGPEGDGIPINASSGGGSIVMTAFDQATCCGNIAGAPITQSNPALPGEIVLMYATGLGVPILTDEVQSLIQTGVKYPATGPNTLPQSAQFVSSLAGGSTADVLSSTLLPGTVGTFQVLLHLNSGIVTQPYTLATIAQATYVSNQVTFPVVNPSGISGAEPTLEVVCNHPGNFTLGESGASYSVTVSNGGALSPTSGTITVVDTIPVGETLVSMIGTGWSCSGNTCTRSDALPAGGTYPVITVIVNVASNADTSVTNSVRATGGNSAAAQSNDLTTISGTAPSNPPVLTTQVTHSGNFTLGQSGATYTITVSNAHGASATSGAVSVLEVIPAGLSLTAISGTNWNCASYTCTRTDSLGGGSSYPPITVTFAVASNAPSTVVNQVVTSGGGSATTIASNTTTIGH